MTQGGLLRGTFLTLSECGWARSFATKFPPSVRASRRFIAGEELDEALEAVATLNRSGCRATLDYLGESVDTPAAADQYTQASVRILERVRERKLDCNLSIKLTGMGLDLSEELALANLSKVLAAADDSGNFVRIDMEGSAYTERTLSLYRKARKAHANTGVVIQAYLRRSAEDVERLAAEGASVRLCKGAYREPPEVAFPEKADVDASYKRLAERMLDSETLARGMRPAIATHDPAMISHVQRIAAERGVRADQFEFQTLYGIRRDLQKRIVSDGYALRIYVPFGEAWYPYFMRRLAERPANVGFVLRNLWRER